MKVWSSLDIFQNLYSFYRCVLAGDHLQLPPTIISEKAAKKGLSVTLLERVVKGCGENAVKMLTTQYRCVILQRKSL